MRLRLNVNTRIALGLLLLMTLTCSPLLSNQVLAVYEDGLGYVTGKIFMMNSLKMGELPLWNPYAGIGTPFLADVQNTVFSPFNILYFIFDVPLVFNIMRVLQMFIASFFMYLLVEELITERFVSVVVGVIFGFSTMMGGSRIEHHTFATTIALFPAILYYLEKYKQSQNEKWLAFSAVVMAIQFLSGFTQICLYFDVLALVYFVYVLQERNVALKVAFWKIFKWGGAFLALISVQLLPLLRLMQQSGRGKVSWDFFSSYAYDLRILLMMFFPDAYINNICPFDEYHSSGFDIEIYIGIICLVYIVYEVFWHYKEKRIRILTNISIAAFIYGMIPHIPILGKLVFYIPIIGSFRCSARAIFLFLFCSLLLFGLGLSNIKEKTELRKILKINQNFILLLGCSILILLCILSQDGLFVSGLTQAYRTKFLVCMCMALGMLLLNYILLKLTEKHGRESCVKIVSLILGIVIVCDVSRFSRIADETIGEIQEILPSHLSADVDETLRVDTENHFRSFLALEDVSDLSQQFARLGKSGRALNEEKLLYNSYVTFLDKKLDFWRINGTLLYPQFINTVNTQNDLLSMMGIRHIIDTKDSNMKQYGMDGTVEKVVCELNEIILPASTDVTAFVTEADWIEKNSMYEIVVQCEEDKAPTFFNVDFYGQNYDEAEQEAPLYRVSGKNEYSAIISTGEVPFESPIYFRILGNSDTNFLIENVIINKLHSKLNLKSCPNEDEAVNIYENINARPLLYVPEHIYSITSYGENREDSEMENVDKNNYIVGLEKEMNLTMCKTKIQNINMRRNSIRAKIVANQDTFIDFSQLSYPGWKAYVDGKQVKCYTVNNLIIGAEVPEGSHVIEFKFSPNDVKIGLLITITGVLMTLMWVFGNRREGAE